MWNLYGPTETNVCTAQQIPHVIPEARTEPFPIGRVCEPLKASVLDEGNEHGLFGELVISGPGVMRGYFGRSDLTDLAFLIDEHGERWYRTGDLVDDDGTGTYTFRGRRDRMVKKRGYRIELGEIESAIHRHEDVESAAVIASDSEEGTAISAFVAMKPGCKGSIIAMKRHCTAHLPHYMIPDRVAFVEQMPRTSTDKVDYQGLARLATNGQTA
jgi:acyl-coenzyme A synthetase/AMP-(fatty) acid ligase